MFLGERGDPIINPESRHFRRWTYEVSHGMDRGWISDHLNQVGVSPEFYPNVCDLCSGDGSVAAILVENGWEPSRITCVDQFKSPSPLVVGVNWNYFNITDLVWALRNGQEIPDDISRLRNLFDLVTLFQGYAGMDIDGAAC